MPSRVLLISVNRCTAPDPVFPLGLAQLNRALRAAGHEVRWYDMLASAQPPGEVLAEFQPDLAGISIRNIDDVLIRKQQTYFDDLPSLCATIHRQANCPVVLGGSGFSIFPKELLSMSGADYGICGSGEKPLVQLLAALESRKSPAGIPGLLSSQIPEVPVEASGQGESETGFGGADLPDAIVTHYLRSGGMLNVQTQRGCAFHCCYCTYPLIEGRMHCRRNPEAVAEEFEIASRKGAKYVFVVDSVFNSSPRHVHDICEALLKRNSKLSWGCFLRPQGLTSELVSLMSRAGMAHAEFGSDSFSDRVLAAYHKGLSFDDIQRSSELARNAQIDFCHFLICGGPGETVETLEESFANSRKLLGAVVMAVVGMRIYPGTELHRRALAEQRITPETSLLNPTYYVSPGLTVDETFLALQRFSAESPNWIAGDPSPAYARLVEQLRSRGIVGPLWSYLSMIQRLWPTPPQAAVSSGRVAAGAMSLPGGTAK